MVLLNSSTGFFWVNENPPVSQMVVELYNLRDNSRFFKDLGSEDICDGER